MADVVVCFAVCFAMHRYKIDKLIGTRHFHERAELVPPYLLVVDVLLVNLSSQYIWHYVNSVCLLHVYTKPFPGLCEHTAQTMATHHYFPQTLVEAMPVPGPARSRHVAN